VSLICVCTDLAECLMTGIRAQFLARARHTFAASGLVLGLSHAPLRCIQWLLECIAAGAQIWSLTFVQWWN